MKQRDTEQGAKIDGPLLHNKYLKTDKEKTWTETKTTQFFSNYLALTHSQTDPSVCLVHHSKFGEDAVKKMLDLFV